MAVAVAVVVALAVCGPATMAAGAGASPTGAPRGGGPTYDGSITKILSPSPGAVLSGGRMTVMLRSNAPRRSLHVLLNGKDITGRLSRTGGVYTAAVAAGSMLHPGGDLLTASTHHGGRFDFDHAGFTLARSERGMLRMRGIRIDGRGAPATILGRAPVHARVRAWVNGHRDDAPFADHGGRLDAQLGASDWLRAGSNRVVLVADTSSPRMARESSISRRFRVPGDEPIASAGPDRTVLEGQSLRLDGAGSQLPRGDAGSFSWRIVSAPNGSDATLGDPTSATPELTPDKAGTYRIAVTQRARTAGTADGARGTPTVASTDTVLVTSQPSAPYGVSLQTNTDGLRGGIKLDGQVVPNTVRAYAGFSYAVLNRATLQVTESGENRAPTTTRSLDELLQLARRYSDGRSIMVIDFTAHMEGGDLAQLADLFKQLGGGPLPPGDNFTQSLPGSMVGVPGAPAGSAFLNHRDVNNLPDPGEMSGYLRLNNVSDLFDFVFADAVPVDTDPGQTATETQIKVGDRTYKGSHPAGVSGFQMLRLDPKTLAPLANFTYTTNSADGTQQASDQTRLANDLTFATTEVERPLVILQSYGQPTGSTGEWDRAALAIEKLGGTRQVFNDLNQPQGGGDDEQGRKGGYAFIGRFGSGAPRAEVSYPLDGLPARLKGLLMRSRMADYEPTLVSAARPDGSSPVNEELVRIANQAPTPFPVLAPTASRTEAQAAESFLGGPEVMGVCQTGQPCNVRQTYYTNYGGSWLTIATALQNAKEKCQQTHAGFSTSVCEQVRSQLFDEVQATNRVRHYLGPEGLQQPFGAAGVAALANIGEISDTIQRAVNPPPADNTTSKALNITSFVLKIGTLAGAVNPAAGAVASGLGAVFGLAGYLTKKDNAANLIGPEVQTQAAKLGVELAGRYQTAGDQLDGLGRIIVSDYGKLNAVASKVDSDPSWILGAPGQAREGLIRGAKQSISETLIPKAWPVLYDLGYPTNRNARDWNCYYQVFVTKHKFLFADEPNGGQVVERFPKTAWAPTMAIGGVHATGSVGDARIPTPPASVIDPLFQSTALGGLGLKKLEFFSPSLFRYFPASPERTTNQRLSLGADTRGQGYSCVAIPNPPDNSG